MSLQYYLEAGRDYVKCCIANKAALGSGIILGSSLTSFIVNSGSTSIEETAFLTIAAEISGLISLSTGFGFHTYHTYRKTKNHIQEHGTIDPRFAEKISKWYCNQAGARLAAKEAGLEDLLPNVKIKYHN